MSKNKEQESIEATMKELLERFKSYEERNKEQESILKTLLKRLDSYLLVNGQDTILKKMKRFLLRENELESSKTRLQKEKKKLERFSKNAVYKINVLKNENVQLKKSKEELENENVQLKKDIKQLEKRIRAYIKNVSKLQNEQFRLQARINHLLQKAKESEKAFSQQKKTILKLEKEKSSFEEKYQAELKQNSREEEEGSFVTRGGHDEIVLRLQTFRDQRFKPFAKKTSQVFDSRDRKEAQSNRYFTEQILCEHLFQVSGSRWNEDIIENLTHIGTFELSDDWLLELEEIICEAEEIHKMIAANKPSRGYFTFVTRQYFSSKLHEADRRCPNEKGAFVLFTLFPGYFTLNPRKYILKPLVFTTKT